MTPTNPALTELREILGEVADLTHVADVLGWDQETYMPAGAVSGRADQMATVQKVAHARFTSDTVGGLLEQLEREAAGWDFDSDEASLVRVARRDYDQAVKFPAELIEELARAEATARPIWLKARAESDWSQFVPAMQRTVELAGWTAEALGYAERPYDALVDRAEPGMTTALMESLFEDLKAAIVPLVREIAGEAAAVDDSPIRGHFPRDAQLGFSLQVVADLGYDLRRGRLDLSAHPFSTAFGSGDVRITTRVSEDLMAPCLFGSMHESGHAMYSQGHNPAFERNPLFGGASSGVHESQSRLWENQVGRSRPFWKRYLAEARKAFPGSLDGTDAEGMYRAVNKVQPSYIRVESDEVTYNLHVLLRFEIEKDLLEGRLSVKDVPEAWNSKLKEYLGLPPPPASEGPLQDIHWTFPSLAEFVGYTVGNVISAQLMDAIRQDLPNLDDQIEAGDFAPLLGWLRAKVHVHGRKFTPNELVERATGRPMGAQPWIAYVRRKFGEIYRL